MKTFIQKYYPRTKWQKVEITIFSIFVIYLIGNTFLSIKGRDFPLEQDLTYTTGTLDYYGAASKNSVATTILRSEQPKNKDLFFGCNYSAYLSQAIGSCMDKKSLEPYLGKQATAGWYYQPEFLGFKNNRPQLVSLEVDDKYIMTYNQTIELIPKLNRSKIYINGFFIILSCSLFLFCFYTKNNDDPEHLPRNT